MSGTDATPWDSAPTAMWKDGVWPRTMRGGVPCWRAIAIWESSLVKEKTPGDVSRSDQYTPPVIRSTAPTGAFGNFSPSSGACMPKNWGPTAVPRVVVSARTVVRPSAPVVPATAPPACTTSVRTVPTAATPIPTTKPLLRHTFPTELTLCPMSLPAGRTVPEVLGGGPGHAENGPARGVTVPLRHGRTVPPLGVEPRLNRF